MTVVLLSAVVGVIAYNVGLSHGIEQGAAAQGTPVTPYPYGWYRPWGFGFPLLFFVLLWFLLLRGLWWGRPWWRHRYYKGVASSGSGLGLTIARSLVSAHGGTIAAESRPGEGTTVIITLPVSV